MITLVGVGHVFQLRQRIEGLVERRRPDLVCIELDEDRYRFIRQKEREGKYPSMTVALLARFQSRTAEMFGTTVGDEMIAAVDAAQELGVPHEFIDMDGYTVMQKLRKEMTIKERFWAFVAAIGAQFISKKRIEKELKEYEENPEAYEDELERRFPTFKRILIDERNAYMAWRIAQSTTTHGAVMAIVGDGHVTATCWGSRTTWTGGGWNTTSSVFPRSGMRRPPKDRGRTLHRTRSQRTLAPV